MITQKQIDNFWSHVDIKGEGECWEWMASCYSFGYGQVGVNHKTYSAHRFSWMITNGEIPERLCILHHCDNPQCVNPNHLFIGTNQDNVTDREKKGRGKIKGGEKNINAKLTNEQVAEIRKLYIRNKRGQSSVALGDKFGVDSSVILRIVNNETWKTPPHPLG